MSEEATHFGQMAALARMGFNIVPSVIHHREKGSGLLYMNGEGLRFVPTDHKHGEMTMTWTQFDEGALECSSKK